MAQSGGQDQPSMEEILASIRRIISEDEAGEGEKPAASAADEQPEEEVLDLTDRVEGPRLGFVARPAPIPTTDKSTPPPRPSETEAPRKPAEEGLLSGQAAAAAVAALAQAGRRPAGSSGTVAAESDAQTLDALVRQALTPLLKAWLDENLPALVERIVREEVRRLAQQARDG